jgi:hypothetical protein
VGLIKETNAGGKEDSTQDNDKKDDKDAKQTTPKPDMNESSHRMLDELHTSASRESSEIRDLMRVSRNDAARNRASAIAQIRRSMDLIEDSGDTIPAEKKETLLAELAVSLKDLHEESIVKSRRGSVMPVFSLIS